MLARAGRPSRLPFGAYGGLDCHPDTAQCSAQVVTAGNRETEPGDENVSVWRCPVCGARVRDKDLKPGTQPPVHDHGTTVELVREQSA